MFRTEYPTFSDARSNFKSVLDAAEAELPVSVHRGSQRFRVISEDFFLRVLTQPRLVPVPEVYEENDGWTVVLPGVPISADSTNFGEAVDDFVDALREYAKDWIHDEDLRRAPSHRGNAVLVALVDGLSHEALREWVVGSSDVDPANGAGDPVVGR